MKSIQTRLAGLATLVGLVGILSGCNESQKPFDSTKDNSFKFVGLEYRVTEHLEAIGRGKLKKFDHSIDVTGDGYNDTVAEYEGGSFYGDWKNPNCIVFYRILP